jgi:hypothetical protein
MQVQLSYQVYYHIIVSKTLRQALRFFHQLMVLMQTFGENACHPERSEGSGSLDKEILRCAQDDSQNTAHVCSREAFSPSVRG